MKAVREQIRDTGQVGGSNEFPKVEAAEATGWPATIEDARKMAREALARGPHKCAAPIAPAAVAETTDKLPPLELTVTVAEDLEAIRNAGHDVGGNQLLAAQQHIANLESELKMARDLIQKMRQQLTAANLGSSMQHERYGSY